MRTPLLLSGLFFLPVVALAKLGDTRAETEKNWGAPTTVEAEMNTCQYRKGDFTLTEAYNRNGRAMSSDYMKKGSFTKEEYIKLMQGNIPVKKYTKSQVQKIKTKTSITEIFKDGKYIVQQAVAPGLHMV